MKKKDIKIDSEKNFIVKKIISRIFHIIIIMCVLYHIIFLVNTAITKKNHLDLFGKSLLVMNTDSMNPDMKKNDLLIVVPQSKYNKEDIIAYTINGKLRVNKVLNTKLENGEVLYKTKSNANINYDLELISKNQIIGKVSKRINGLGIIINILQSKITTIIISIGLIFKILCNKYIYKKSRQRKIKKEKSKH